MVGAPKDGEIVCHNDLAPFNAVFQDGLPAGCVSRLGLGVSRPSDVGHRLCRLAVRSSLRRRHPTRLDNGRRGAGLSPPLAVRRVRPHRPRTGTLVGAVERRIRCSFETLEAWGREGKPGWSEMWQERTHGEGMLRDLAYVAEHRDALNQALT